MDIHYRINRNVVRTPKPLDASKQKSLIKDEDCRELMQQCFVGNELIIHPHVFYTHYSKNQIWLMMTEMDVYVLPTEELFSFLDSLIGEKSAIEVGAGKGYLGRELNIPTTDSYAKRYPYPMKRDKDMGIPTIVYPKDVEKLDAIKSIKKYRPHTVVSSFLVSEKKISRWNEIWSKCQRYSQNM